MKLTNKQLSSLPEFPEYETEVLSDGSTVKHRRVGKFASYKPNQDDVVIFTDKDGTWFVDYHLEGGPYKRRALI